MDRVRDKEKEKIETERKLKRERGKDSSQSGKYVDWRSKNKWIWERERMREG